MKGVLYEIAARVASNSALVTVAALVTSILVFLVVTGTAGQIVLRFEEKSGA